MRWFKHYSDMHEGRTIGELMEKMGHTGLCFFLLQELCAEKLEKPENSDEKLTDAACSFTFRERNVRQKLRISAANLRQLLAICAANGQLSYAFRDELLEIKMPILLDLLTSDSKKARSRRDDVATKPRLDKEEDKDVEKIKKKISKKTKSVPTESPKANAFVAKYCSLFKARWGENPVITKKDAGIASRLSMTLSPEKHDLYLEAYFSMPDAWLAKIKHPLAAFESKLNEVVVYAGSGTFTTNRQANQADDFASNMILLEKVRAGLA